MKQVPDRLALMQTFIRIVEAGNLSAAAAQMNTTQPTVSRRLQALERSLGLTLLQRSTHTQRLTEAGARFYERARELVLSWSEFESDLRGGVDEAQGLLRVVAPHAFGQHRLVGPLARYLADNPKVSVEWTLHDIEPDFIEEGIDCAIHVGEVSASSVVAIKIGEVPRIVVGTPELMAGRKLPRTPKDLAAMPWLALTPYYRNEVFLRNARGDSQTIAIAPRITTDSLYALRSAVLRGVGIAVVSRWLIQDELEEGLFVRLLPDWQAQSMPVYLLYPYAPFYPAKLRYFIEAMRHAMDG